MFSTKELYDGVFKVIGIPIVYDIHHHTMCTGGQTDYEAMSLAVSTWPKDIPPVIHYSQSRAVEHNNPKIRPQAHSDSYWKAVETYEFDVYVMLECKHKQEGLFKMRELMAGSSCMAAK